MKKQNQSFENVFIVCIYSHYIHMKIKDLAKFNKLALIL